MKIWLMTLPQTVDSILAARRPFPPRARLRRPRRGANNSPSDSDPSDRSVTPHDASSLVCQRKNGYGSLSGIGRGLTLPGYVHGDKDHLVLRRRVARHFPKP